MLEIVARGRLGWGHDRGWLARARNDSQATGDNGVGSWRRGQGSAGLQAKERLGLRFSRS